MKYRHEFDSKYFRNFLCLKASFILILWRRSKFNKCQPLYYLKKLAFLNYCFGYMIGVPKGNRTPDTKFRKLVLYPTELLAHFLSCFLLYYFIVLYYFIYLFFIYFFIYFFLFVIYYLLFYLLFFICYLLFTFFIYLFFIYCFYLLLFICYFFNILFMFLSTHLFSPF